MSAVVVTTCTDRKKVEPNNILLARSLRSKEQSSLSKEWAERVSKSTERVAIDELYAGRSYKEAVEAASVLEAELYVISAGLGLVSQRQKVPAYNLTMSGTSENSIKSKIEQFNASKWWGGLPFNRRKHPLSYLIQKKPNTIFLIALSRSYASLVAEDLGTLSSSDVERLRLFGLALNGVLPGNLRKSIMPYDHRFDGRGSPLPGTRTDFAQRALRHFVGICGERCAGKLAAHHRLIEEHLSVLSPRRKIVRETKTDDEVVKIIKSHYRKTQLTSGKMLRLFRDEIRVACEQARFSRLYKIAIAELA